MSVEFRKIFDTIPDQFDCYRPRYCDELFRDMIDLAKISKQKTVLEMGPGTGQASEPILKTGCDYLGIELGEHLAAFMQNKFSSYPNFRLILDDFITHDFGDQRFDTIYSAATIQWIPEEIAFPKVFSLLKPGGMLVMMLTRSDYQTPNEPLYQEIQKVYSAHFKPTEEYKGGFQYKNCLNYGFEAFEAREYHGQRIMNAEQFAAYSGTHCTHLVIEEEHREAFFDGLKKTIQRFGDRIVVEDTYVLMTARKPSE